RAPRRPADRRLVAYEPARVRRPPADAVSASCVPHQRTETTAHRAARRTRLAVDHNAVLQAVEGDARAERGMGRGLSSAFPQADVRDDSRRRHDAVLSWKTD